MLKRAFISFLFLFSLLNYISAEQFSLQDFSGGLVDRFTADRIADKYSPDMLNVYVDKDSGITKRRGYIKYLSTALTEQQKIRSIHTYPKNNGTDYFLFNSSWSIYYSLGGGDKTSLVSGKNSAYNYIFANALDYVYGSNGNDNMFMWDGATYTEYTAANSTNVPKGDIMIWHKNRLWIAGVTGQLSTLFYSQLIDPPNFGIVATDNMEYLSQNDGDYITGLWSMEDILLVFKRYSVWGLYGTAPSNWVIRCIDAHIGCLYQSSIASYKGYPTWLSREGIMQFDGVKLNNISGGIDNFVKGLNQLEIKKQILTDTNQEDFRAGTEFIAVDTFTSITSLLNGNGTTSYMYPSIHKMQNNGILAYEYGAGIAIILGDHYQTFMSSISFITSRIEFLNQALSAGQFFIDVVKNNDLNTILARSTATCVGSGFSTFTFSSITILAQQIYRIRICQNAGNNAILMMSQASAGDTYPAGRSHESVRDWIFSVYGSSCISRYTSQIHNAGTDWKQWGLFQENHSKTDGTSIDFSFRTSTFSAGINLTTFTAISNSYDIASTTGPFIQWRSSSSAGAYSIDDVTLNYYEDTPTDDPVGITYDNRYWLAVATDTVKQSNNVVLVYNEDKAFTFFNNLNIGSACLYRDKLYTGSAIDNGMIYRQDVSGVYSDDGTDYDSYYTTKIFDTGNPFVNKIFRALYLSAENSGNWNVEIGYRVNGSSAPFTTKNVNLNVGDKTLAKKIPLQLAKRGQYIQFRFRNATAGQYFGIKRLDCVYEGLPLR